MGHVLHLVTLPKQAARHLEVDAALITGLAQRHPDTWGYASTTAAHAADFEARFAVKTRRPSVGPDIDIDI